MSGSLTIRLPEPALRKLRQRARERGATPSEVVRSLVERELDRDEPTKTALELSRRWVGVACTGPVTHGADTRKALENWVPDRRG